MTAHCQNREMLDELAFVTYVDIVPVLQGSDPHLASTAALCLGHQMLNPTFYKAFSLNYCRVNPMQCFQIWFSETICDTMLGLCKHKDPGVAARAVLAVGLICKGMHADQAEHEAHCLMGLVAMQNNKSEELQCGIGEALALSLAKQSISSDLILISNFTCLRNAPLDLEAPSIPEGAVEMHGGVLDALLVGLTHSRTENRSACVSHLVTLMTYCPRHPAIQQRLERSQKGFLGLLGDKNGLTQEMASRGVSLVYSIGDQDTKSQLLTGLTSVLKDPTKKGPMVKVDGDTQVFEAGELGTVPGGGGNLTTYRELCSLAKDMGQPDLLYKFMDLANHQAALNSRRGAAVGFAHIAKLAGDDLKPYLSTMLPRIYRLQFDPNPEVQETMSNIWQSLVPETRNKLEEFLPEILKELMTEITSRIWRHRESSARAMADLLQGRQWDQLKDTFAQIWKLAFRVADDIKETVRQAGIHLLTAMKRISLKFADGHVTDAMTVSAAVSETLPVLLEVIAHPTDPACVAIAFSTISSIAASCPTELLRPHLGTLVPSLLESLSKMDSGVLDELQLRMAGAGVNPEKLESARVRAVAYSPVQDILDRCLRTVDVSTLEKGELMPNLKELIQRGVGLNTRVGTMRFVTQLAIHLGTAFDPYAGKFLKILLSKSLSGEASSTIKKAYASAIGTLCNVAASQAVGKVVDGCVTALKCQENVDQHMIGLIFKELHAHAPSYFSGHASTIIPVAFLKRFESDASVASIWASVFEEGMGTESGAVRLFHEEIVKEVTSAFSSTSWSAKIAAANAIEQMYEADKATMQTHSQALMQMLLEQLPGRIWDGKEALFKAISKICSQDPSGIQEFSISITNAFKAACTKGRKEYRYENSQRIQFCVIVI